MPNEHIGGAPEPKKKPPKIGFRRRYNYYYEGMTKRQIAIDTSKTVFRWLMVTLFLYVYWLAMLLLLSIFLLNVWHVTIVRIMIYAGALCVLSSVVYAFMLVHRKFYY